MIVNFDACMLALLVIKQWPNGISLKWIHCPTGVRIIEILEKYVKSKNYLMQSKYFKNFLQIFYI